MAVDVASLDAHEQPSDELRAQWKAYSKAEQAALSSSGDIDDLDPMDKAPEFVYAGNITAKQLNIAFGYLNEGQTQTDAVCVTRDAPIYYHPLLPGLLIVPAVLPPNVQIDLLDRLVHRDLSNPDHTTNLHLHYNIPYSDISNAASPDAAGDTNGSFFSLSPDSAPLFLPKNPAVHHPWTIKQVMDRRLHWVTLGGQYDWTDREYPAGRPPDFPPDIAAFLRALFPETVPQAAIVNFYGTGDSMMMHRDVSEEVDRGLVSLSIGCDALFMIAPPPGEREHAPGAKTHLLLRLRSGDALYMTKEARFAWHGVPKILDGTCPAELADWPAREGKYEAWKGWLSNKRINVNVRQMRD